MTTLNTILDLIASVIGTDNMEFVTVTETRFWDTHNFTNGAKPYDITINMYHPVEVPFVVGGIAYDLRKGFKYTAIRDIMDAFIANGISSGIGIENSFWYGDDVCVRLSSNNQF